MQNCLQNEWISTMTLLLLTETYVNTHTDPNWSILSKKYNPGQPIQKLGFWLSSRPFWIITTFSWVHQGPPAIVLIFFWNWLLYRILKYAVTNFRKKIRSITGGSWWTQIKVVLIQKGQLDNQHPGFCMGWPGLYVGQNRAFQISVQW